MNKTIMIHLGGGVFHIEEDAYQTLKNYLDTIKSNFSGDPGQQEIMQDIEARIAEIFRDLMGTTRNVVQLPDVNEVINTMGKPEDYGGSGKQEDTPPAGEAHVRNKNRRVYRDMDDCQIGGVCAGLSHYLGWDPLVLRVAAVILLLVSFGTVMLVYLILWAVMPVAETTAEKLQMRGEPVNIENIRKKVTEEAQQAGENIRSAAGKFAHQAEKGSKNVAEGFGKIVTKIVGFILLFFGLGILFALLGSWLTADIKLFSDNNVTFTQLDNYIFGESGTAGWLLAGILLTVAAPCISLIYSGIKLLFGLRTKIPGLGWGLFLLFICGVIILAWKGVGIARLYDEDARITQNYHFENDTVFLSVNDDPHFHNAISHYERDFFDLIKADGDLVYFGEPVNLQLFHTDDDQIRMEIITMANGQTKSKAIASAEEVQYGFTIDGDSISLDPFLALPTEIPYRGHHVDINLYIPGGKSVSFGKNIHHINWHDDFDNTTQTMKRNGKWLGRDDDEVDLGYDTNIHINEDGIRISSSENDDSVHVRIGDLRISAEKE
ncbi:MAG: PspC domain-containing protein [Flavobacteriales bacterium]|nr:PspC domain-containing protein [Flavobacteriales bacterium]